MSPDLAERFRRSLARPGCAGLGHALYLHNARLSGAAGEVYGRDDIVALNARVSQMRLGQSAPLAVTACNDAVLAYALSRPVPDDAGAGEPLMLGFAELAAGRIRREWRVNGAAFLEADAEIFSPPSFLASAPAAPAYRSALRQCAPAPSVVHGYAAGDQGLPAIVDAFHALFAVGDAEALEALLADDCVLRIGGFGTGYGRRDGTDLLAMMQAEWIDCGFLLERTAAISRGEDGLQACLIWRFGGAGAPDYKAALGVALCNVKAERVREAAMLVERAPTATRSGFGALAL